MNGMTLSTLVLVKCYWLLIIIQPFRRPQTMPAWDSDLIWKSSRVGEYPQRNSETDKNHHEAQFLSVMPVRNVHRTGTPRLHRRPHTLESNRVPADQRHQDRPRANPVWPPKIAGNQIAGRTGHTRLVDPGQEIGYPVSNHTSSGGCRCA